MSFYFPKLKGAIAVLGLALVLSAPSSWANSGVAAKIDFDNPSDKRAWVSVNDGVMGGLSSGGPKFADGVMTFSGLINTNGGGFSSIRRRFDGARMQDARAMRLRVKTDGRAYRLRFRTDATYRGRPIAFQTPIEATQSGQWQVIDVPLDNMNASIFGRRLKGAKFVPENVVEMGIIIADGQDGPFQIEIDWMEVLLSD